MSSLSIKAEGFITVFIAVFFSAFLSGCLESTEETEVVPSYTISGVIISEEEVLVEDALVTINGIEATTLTDAQGTFTVESPDDFLDTAFLSVAKDGFEPYSDEVTLTGDGTTYTLTDTITLLEALPWDYLEIEVISGNSLQASQFESLFSRQLTRDFQLASGSGAEINGAAMSRDHVCDCTVTLAGKALKQGGKKTEVYIMFAVDASGSSAETFIGNQSIFEIEIEALKALVDSLTEDSKLNVAIVRFASDATLELDFSSDLATVKSTLNLMSPEEPRTSGAATNYKAALELITSTFKAEKVKKDDIQTVVFLSDGIPTAPFDSGLTQELEDRLSSIGAASLLKKENIVVNTFPVNVASKLTTLPAISAITGGYYYNLDSDKIVNEINQYSVVGLKGLEVINETNDNESTEFTLAPDGWFNGEVCLSDDGKNKIKITPLVCNDCKKAAYQKISASCQGEECSECAGQVTMLELKYQGSIQNAQIRVEQGKKNKNGTILFDDTVSPQQTFEFYGSAKDKTMGPDISIYINGAFNTEFHTSCSKSKTAPGQVNGDFLLVRGYSRNGGLLCPDDDD